MYNQNKIIAGLIALGFVAEVALMVTTLALVIPEQTFTPDCLVASSPGIYMAYWCARFLPNGCLSLIERVGYLRSALRRFCSS